MKVVVRRTNGTRPWYYRVVAKNGQVILVSETYSTKANAVRAASRFLAVADRLPTLVTVTDHFSVNKFKP